MIEAAAALKLVLYFSLLICLFVPFGIATGEKGIAALVIGAAVWIGKLVVLAALLPIGETAIAKMRVFRYPIFLGGAFAAGALAVFLLFVSKGF
jgi:formate hydrogenlyase subunit 4